METWMSNFHNLLTLDNKLLQTDVSSSFLCVMFFFIILNKEHNSSLFLYLDDRPGRGRGGSPWDVEVSDLRQCRSVRSEVWRGVPAVPAPLRHRDLEPPGVHRPRGQVWPGEASGCFFGDVLGINSFCDASMANPPLCVAQLVSNAIQFLASVCERPHYKNLFEDQNTLTSICEKVIVPNMEFRSESL